MFKYLILLIFFITNQSVFAATGEETYQAKCSSCHDSGAGGAPRVSEHTDWTAREPRGRAAMHESALKGIPATAMAAKGGFAELTDEQVRATVEYMLARAGFRARTVIASRPQSAAAAAMPAARVEDATLVTRVAEALRQALAPAARIEHYAGEAILHGVTIRVAARDGVIVLSGAVQKSEVIARAQATAQGVAGVGKVESRLVTAGMMDFD